MDLVGNPADSVSDCLEDDDPSKPAVDQVHGVKRNSGEVNDGVVATSQEEQGDHVDDSHDARAAQELASTC